MRFFLLIISVLSSILLASGFFYYQFTKPLLMQEMVLEIKAGENINQFAETLVQEKVLTYSKPYILFMSLQNTPLKKGEYYFPKHSSFYSIWQQVSKGTGFYYRSFTIVPGWTIAQLKQALIKNNNFHHVAAMQSNEEWSKQLNLTSLPEGLFFPETYFYTKGMSDWSILHIAHRLMLVKLNAMWEKRDPNLPFKTPYEALIAASLVEKEAFQEEERPIIAGVLINRLNKKMRLQFDPTIIYGLGDKFTGQIKAKDLKEKTPYNTYTNLGLPPTPIALPGVSSIEAVLHPKEHHYLYFVLANGNEKRHLFSATLVQHQKAVKAYRKQESIQ